MPSALVSSTIQACVLNATSNIIAQLLTAYRSKAAYTVDWTPVLQFIIFNALSCPPNFLWQSFLESTFPTTHLVPTTSTSTSPSPNLKPHTTYEPKLSISNTLCKFLLDQTLGATINTLLFSLAFAGFNGMGIPEAWSVALREFWPLMTAGWKVWPLISALNFAVVRDPQTRMLVGSLAGLGWGIYLSLSRG